MLLQKLRKRKRSFVILLLLHGDQIFQLRAAFPYDGRHVLSHLIQDKHLGVGTVHQLAELFGRKGNVQGHGHIARVYDSKVGHQPGVRGQAGQRHMGPLRQQGGKSPGKAFAVMAKLRIAAGGHRVLSRLEADRVQGTVCFLASDEDLPDRAAQTHLGNLARVFFLLHHASSFPSASR